MVSMPHTQILRVLKKYYPNSISVGHISYVTGLTPNHIYECIHRLQQNGISISVSDDGEEQVKILKEVE